ncbi:MAG: glycosyl hydrolase family 39 [Acidobacteria bacterium]|nr:glycosyl hydrolase family 39 [Acidobacteriota bacterium]
MFTVTLKRLLLAAAVCLVSSGTLSAQDKEEITIHATAPSKPFPHFWEGMFGSGRAILSLRESYRNDLRAVKSVTDFRYVRFHAILHDELGVYNEDAHGEPVYNFNYIDDVYDGLLANGVRPVVEISFMPKKLAFNPDDLHPFWYKQNVSPPKSMARWDDLMTALGKHLVERYGIEEVSQWYFEVWNEPNIDFWGGIPRKESYFNLYAHTARDLKKVSPRLRVGGPATAAAAWIPDFLSYCSENHVPVDFVSTHAYANEPVKRLLGTDEVIAPEGRMGAVVAKVRHQIDASPIPHLPLLWTEWNVDPAHGARETPYVGPAVANVIRETDGMVDYLSFWTFSEVFEEGGPPNSPFHHFGLRAIGGINKPAFYDFALLHQLGDERIANDAHNVLVTRRFDGSIAIVLWNLVPPGESGHHKTITLHFDGVRANSSVSISCVDETHGNVIPFFKAMGSPNSPTQKQVQEFNDRSNPGPAERRVLERNSLTVTLGPNALYLLVVPAKQ